MSIGLAQTCRVTPASVQVLCIADINRAGSQAYRGGGALCFTNNPGIWQTFYRTITQQETCATG